MRKILPALVLLAGCTNRPPVEPPVNGQVTRSVDLTGDGRPENVTLMIKAANAHAPVQWLLTVESGGRTILEHDSDDEAIDPLFDDRSALPGCADYLTCKQQYYFQSILDNLVDTDWTPDDLLDMARGGRLPPMVRSSVEACCGLTGPALDKAVADLEARIRDKRATLIVVPRSPADPGPRMAWVPEAGQFVDVE